MKTLSHPPSLHGFWNTAIQVCVLWVLSLPGVVLANQTGSPFNLPFFFEPAPPFSSARLHPDWSNMVDRHAAALPIFARCYQDQTRCPGVLQSYRTVVMTGQTLEPDARIALANVYINHQQKRAQSRHPAHAAGRWYSPLEFLTFGGDREAIAIAKYFLLRDMGVTAQDMRLVVAHAYHQEQSHTVLVVRADRSVYLLEPAGADAAVPADAYYDYVYALNEHSFWDYTVSERSHSQGFTL